MIERSRELSGEIPQQRLRRTFEQPGVCKATEPKGQREMSKNRLALSVNVPDICEFSHVSVGKAEASCPGSLICNSYDDDVRTNEPAGEKYRLQRKKAVARWVAQTRANSSWCQTRQRTCQCQLRSQDLQWRARAVRMHAADNMRMVSAIQPLED
jgi:hypothetical protein